MNLTAERPPQDLLDGLLVDAAWERARMLEGEVKQARAVARQNYESVLRVSEEKSRLVEGILELARRFPAMAIDLRDLLDE